MRVTLRDFDHVFRVDLALIFLNFRDNFIWPVNLSLNKLLIKRFFSLNLDDAFEAIQYSSSIHSIGLQMFRAQSRN